MNGKKLTKAVFKKWIDLRKAMLNKTTPQLKQQDKDGTVLGAVEKQMLATVTNDYTRQVVAADYAKSKNIVASTNRIFNCRMGFSAGAGMARRPWKTVLGSFDKQLREIIEDRVANEALVGSLFDWYIAENNVKVESAEVEKLYANYLAYNKACAATNAVVWTKASNIWERVVSGESFEDIAVEFDEDETRSEDGTWGTYRMADFTDEPEIWRLATKFRRGWISPPVEADNGLMIMKINSVEEPGVDCDAPGYIPSGDAEFNISRIFLHLPLFMEKVSKEKFAAECQEAKKTADFMHFLDELILKADIEFPSGTEIFNTEDSQSQMRFNM